MADKQIKIDPEGVRAFGAGLQSYVDKDIAPTTDFVTYQLQSFGAFGIHSASPIVQDAALQYWNTMNQAITFLSALSHNTGALARTAHDLATTYLDADIDSVGFLNAVVSGASTDLTSAEQASHRADQVQTRDNLLEERRDMHGGAA
ncbi:hypothetical protein ACQP1P_04710 [Dactylosporangium sp. CA-052675]|uniref:hypothetical protein n=1 Tax=Dactylosporangium sp. CA-052675 TaxID=3239927 RepID=UPI003D8D44A7